MTQRKKKSVKKQAPPIPCSTKPVPGVHYHLNMKDVPFVVGTVRGVVTYQGCGFSGMYIIILYVHGH